MANKKVYQIVINGLEESVKSVDTLIQRLGELQKTLNDVSKFKIDIPIELKGNIDSIVSQVQKTVSSAKTDKPTTNTSDDETYNKLLKQRQEALEAVNKTLADTGKNVAEYKEETKQLVAIETQARNEAKGYANTMAGLKQELKDLNAQKNHIDLGSEEFVQVSKRIYDVNAKLKQLEATQNVFSRNVGNYTNAIKEAATEAGNEEKAMQSLQDALEQMNRMKVTVDVGDSQRQFDSLKEATRTLTNEAKLLGLQLEQLKKSGAEGTPEYQKLEQQFRATTEAADDLEHSVANVNQSMSEIQDDSGSIGKMADAFEAFNAVAQVGIGISGLFGQSQEDIQKALNRTIQLTTALNGVRQLLDKTTTSGIIINKVYTTTLNTLSSAFGVQATATSAAAVAMRGFAAALTATGIGAIVVGIGLLINGLSKLIDKIINAESEQTKLNKAFIQGVEKLQQYVDEVEKFNSIRVKLGFIKEIDGLRDNLTKAKDAFEELAEQASKLNGQRTDYKKLFDFDVSNIEKNGKEAINMLESLRYQYVADKEALSKYESQVESAKRKDKEYILTQMALISARVNAYEGLQRVLEIMSSVNEQQKKDNKSRNDRAKKLQEIDKKIEKNTLDAMKDGWNKRLAQLKFEQEQEIKEAEQTAKELKLSEEKKQQLISSIQAKHNKFRLDAERQHLEEMKKLNDDYTNQLISSYSSMMSKFNTYLNNNDAIFSNDALVYEKLVDDTITPLERLKTVTVKTFKDIGAAIKQEYKNWFSDIEISKNLQQNLNKTSEIIQSYYNKEKSAAEAYREAIEIETSVQKTEETTAIANTLKQRLDIQKKYYEETNAEGKDYYDKAVKMQENLIKSITGLTREAQEEGRKISNILYSELKDTLKNLTEDEIKKLPEEYLKTLKTLQDFFDEYTLLDNISKQRMILNEQQYQDRLSEIRTNAAQLTIQAYQKQYDELEKLREKYEQNIQTTIQPLDDIGQFVVKTAETNKFSEACKKLNDQLQVEINKNDITIKKLENELTLINQINEKYNTTTQLTEDELALLESYGFDIKQIKKTYDEINEKKQELFQAEGVVEEYQNALDLLQEQFDNNEISLIDFNQQKAQLTSLFDTAKTMVEKLQGELNNINVNGLSEEIIKALDVKGKGIKLEIFDLKTSNSQLGTLASDIQKWQKNSLKGWKEWSKNVAQVLKASTEIIGSIISNLAEAEYNATMAMIESQLEQLDEYESELEKRLDKQAEIVEKYNDRINDSENELKDARGSRRQFLIDNLAAQQQAYLEEYAVQQKLEEEKEAAEKRREKLEKEKEAAERKRNKANQKVQIAQAIANTALAVTNALAVHPWFLGLALSAVAAAMGAAQIKAISSVKYEKGGQLDGGVAVGKRHSQGGIKVLGGVAEIESGEYITNRITTQKNLPLLEYINSQKKTLTAEDLMKAMKSNVPMAKTSSTARKYASGGQLPTLDAEAIQKVVEVRDTESDNRQYVVAVTDIINVTDNMKRVEVLSGLN